MFVGQSCLKSQVRPYIIDSLVNEPADHKFLKFEKKRIKFVMVQPIFNACITSEFKPKVCNGLKKIPKKKMEVKCIKTCGIVSPFFYTSKNPCYAA